MHTRMSLMSTMLIATEQLVVLLSSVSWLSTWAAHGPGLVLDRVRTGLFKQDKPMAIKVALIDGM